MSEASSIVVRRSRPEDAATLRAIALSIVVAYRLPHDPDLLEYGVRRRRTFAELVAVVDDEPVGTVTLSRHPHARDGGWVSKLFVDPLHRGRGVARALLDATVDLARHGGLAFLELSTLTVFHEAIRFYESSGWKRRPLRRDQGIERRYVLDLGE